MNRFGRRSAVGLCTGALAALLGAGPALAFERPASPPPIVEIGELSGPTPGWDGRMEYWLDVTARDRDGIISEITVEWTGDNHHSFGYAHRSCFFIPGEPGETWTMRIPVSLPPGSYVARVHAHSIPTCGDYDAEQAGPPKQRHFSVGA